MAVGVRRRYDRIAPVYDLFESPMELVALSRWRRRLMDHMQGVQVLEAGVGTGKNLPNYPPGLEITAIDISPRMLERSRNKICPSPVARAVANVEALPFPGQSFDTVLASFLFCSVDDPVGGLEELGRVTRPGGRIVLLEHVRPGNPLLGRLFDRLNPLTRNLFGPNINRDTVGNVARAGLVIEEEIDLSSDIVKLLVCRPGDKGSGDAC